MGTFVDIGWAQSLYSCEGMMAGISAACFKTRVSASEEAQFCQWDETQAKFSNYAPLDTHWKRWKRLENTDTENHNKK